MNNQLSIYLDLFRFTAATLVFTSHVPSFAGGWLWQLSGMGHEAVVLFFILSGFVISYVVYERKEDAVTFAVNRLARIYSVALPALILTLILYYTSHAINSEAYHKLDPRLLNPFWTVFSASLFLNQSWIGTPVFSNLPYWSLGYEVLYYVFFGFLIFAKGKRKFIFILLTLAIMGPSIILYLPIWLLGVLCFKCLHKFSLSKLQAILLFSLSNIGIVIMSLHTTEVTINNLGKEIFGQQFYRLLLEPADRFCSDYLLAIFVALHIYTIAQILKNAVLFKKRVEAIIRHLSNHTFSLYLYHMPILFFISALFPYKSYPTTNLISCWVFTPLLIYLLSRYTEDKKKDLKVFFRIFVNKIRF